MATFSTKKKHRSDNLNNEKLLTSNNQTNKQKINRKPYSSILSNLLKLKYSNVTFLTFSLIVKKNIIKKPSADINMLFFK